MPLHGQFTLRLEPFFSSGCGRKPKILWVSGGETVSLQQHPVGTNENPAAGLLQAQGSFSLAGRLQIVFICRSFDGVSSAFFYLGISPPLPLKLLQVQTTMCSLPHFLMLRTHRRVIGWIQGNGTQDAVLSNMTKSRRVTAYRVSEIQEMCTVTLTAGFLSLSFNLLYIKMRMLSSFYQVIHLIWDICVAVCSICRLPGQESFSSGSQRVHLEPALPPEGTSFSSWIKKNPCHPSHISNICAVRAGHAAWATNLVVFSIGGNSNYVSIVARETKLLA